MGLIRKTLMVGTAGVVRGSSKKQRVAKAQLYQLKAQTKMAADQAEIARMDAARELRRAQARALNAPPAVRQIAAVPAGWYPSPSQPQRLQYFDGARWTPSFADVQRP
jgi:hypothetical protein